MTESPTISKPTDPIKIPTLALRPKEAAKALGISERLLWSRTSTGEIPCVRIGRTVRYPVAVIERWLAEQAGGA